MKTTLGILMAAGQMMDSSPKSFDVPRLVALKEKLAKLTKEEREAYFTAVELETADPIISEALDIFPEQVEAMRTYARGRLPAGQRSKYVPAIEEAKRDLRALQLSAGPLPINQEVPADSEGLAPVVPFEPLPAPKGAA